MFEIRFQKYALKKLQKLLKKNPNLRDKIDSAYEKLQLNPFENTLKTHKVNSRQFGLKYSSSVTGDLRFIWEFNESELEMEIVEILDVGGHSGSNSVY